MEYFWGLFLLALVIFGPVPLCLFLICHGQKSRVSPAKAALKLLTLWSLMQIGLGLCLGSIAHFTARPVFMVEAALLVLGFALLQIFPATARNLWWQIKGLSKSRFWPDEIWILATIAFVALVLLERIATQPFTDYDTLWFHGPIIVRWYQTGSLSQLDPLGNWIIEHPDAHHYPYNWHILSVFFLLSFQQDILAALPMLIAWMMLGLSVYLLSRHLGGERFYALSAAALVLFAPFLLNHVTTLHIDLPLAATYAASLYYLVVFIQTRSSTDLVLFWAIAGLMAGIKTPGIVYAGIVIAVFGSVELLALVSQRYRSVIARPAFWLGILLFSFLGGFWYIKNTLEVGEILADLMSVFDPNTWTASPRSSTKDSLLGAALAGSNSLLQTAKQLQSTTLTAQFEITNFQHWSVFSAQALARLQLPLIALSLQALLVPYAWFKSDCQKQHRSITVSVAIFAITFCLYWNTPYSAVDFTPLVGFNMRYGFPALAVLGVVAAVSGSTLKIHRQLTISVVVISSISGILSSTLFDKIRAKSLLAESNFWPSQLINALFSQPLKGGRALLSLIASMGLQDMILYLLAAVLMIWLLKARLLTHQGKPIYAYISTHWSKYIAVSACITLLLASSVHFQKVRDRNRLYVYQGIDQAIEAFTQPGDRIAYFESRRSYLFYGKHLDRSVIHLPPDIQNTSAWGKTLQQADVALVAIGPTRGADKSLKVLSEQVPPPTRLTPIFGNNPQRNPVFYRLKP